MKERIHWIDISKGIGTVTIQNPQKGNCKKLNFNKI